VQEQREQSRLGMSVYIYFPALYIILLLSCINIFFVDFRLGAFEISFEFCGYISFSAQLFVVECLLAKLACQVKFKQILVEHRRLFMGK